MERWEDMSEIVLGIGSSHGPLLSTPPEQWDLRAKADRMIQGPEPAPETVVESIAEGGTKP